MELTWYRIEAPKFPDPCGGISVDRTGIVRGGAPIFRWMIGKTLDHIKRNCHRHGWTIERLERIADRREVDDATERGRKRVIKVIGRGGLPFYLAPEAITDYREDTDNPDCVMLGLTRASHIEVRATVAELDRLLAILRSNAR